MFSEVTSKDVKQVIGGIVVFATLVVGLSMLFTASSVIGWVVFTILFLLGCVVGGFISNPFTNKNDKV